MHFRVVSHCHSRLVVSENLILLNLRETGSTHYDAAPLIFMNLIIGNMVGAIKNDYAIRVVIDVVVLDPREPGLDRENPLRPRLVDQIIQNNCVR